MIEEIKNLNEYRGLISWLRDYYLSDFDEAYGYLMRYGYVYIGDTKYYLSKELKASKEYMFCEL